MNEEDEGKDGFGMEDVEEAGVVRAVLEELAERVEGVVADEEDCELPVDAWRREMLGIWSLAEGGCVGEVEVFSVLSALSSSSSSSRSSSPSVSSVSSIAESSSKGCSSELSLLGSSLDNRIFWYSSHSLSTLLRAGGSRFSKLADRHSKQ